jgi:Tfp pilus assembly protein PilN
VRAVNLIPLEQRGGSGPAAGRSQGGAYAVLVLLAGLAILALLYGTARHQISSRRAQVASLSVQIQQAQASASQLAPYTSFLALREQRRQAVSQLAQSRFDWARSFHELGRVLPSGASISSLEGGVGSSSGISSKAAALASGSTGSTVTSSTPPGSVPLFTLAGCATSQTVVAQTLTRLRLIEGVDRVTLQSATNGSTGAGGTGGCLAGTIAFTVQTSFYPLPAVSSTSGPAASRKVSNGGAR